MEERVSKEKEQEIMDKLFPNSVVKEDSSRIFSTGARRNDATGKGRYDLLPPEAIEAIAKRFEYGAKLHGENNYKLGVPNSSLFDSALRHMFQALAGMKDEPHLAAAACNICMLLYNEARRTGRSSSPDAPQR